MRVSEALMSSEYMYELGDKRVRAPDYNMFYKMVGDPKFLNEIVALHRVFLRLLFDVIDDFDKMRVENTY